MAIPDNLRKTTFHERKKKRERIARQGEREKAALALPDFQFGRKPSNLLFILIIMIVVGGVLISRVDFKLQSVKKKRNPNVVADKELQNLRIALERFYRDCGRYPKTQEGLKALINKHGLPQWNGPYVNLIKPDPWKHHYRYSFKDGEVTLFSCGPDGIEHTNDDIVPSEPTPEEIYPNSSS